MHPADASPDVPLRQVFQATAFPPEIRLRLAAAGILQIDLLLSLDDTQAGNVSKIKGILGEDDPFGTGSVTIVNEARLVSAWRKVKAISASSDTHRERLREDPLKIPEINYHTYRSNFCAAHRNVIILSATEPHKKSVEHSITDFGSQGSEQVVLKPGLSRNTEQLIKMSQEELPITVTDVEDAVSRLRALLVGF